MSKKASIIISIVLFVVLAVLMVCEVKNPAGGQAFIRSIF